MDRRLACILITTILAVLTKCTAKSNLSLWIDEDQVESIVGHPMSLPIIEQGNVIQYLHEADFEDSLPNIPPEVDTVNLTWEAGDEQFTYWFDGLRSLNKSLLYNPLLSIPASGIIPKGPKIFQMSIPCTGNKKGVATLVLGLQITDQAGRPIRGSPIKLRLRKQCQAFETTTLCKATCQHGGRCNQFGECECAQGYHGKFCEIDMCNPSCENNGTCISPDMCMCLDGFYGARCEKALCHRPCQNGGRCVQSGMQPSGVCWCTSGFYGEACQYSYCKTPCKHEGLCIGPNKCNCRAGYKGDLCEKGGVSLVGGQRPRRSKIKKNQLKKDKERRRCRRKKAIIAKRCLKEKKKKRKRNSKKRRNKDRRNKIDKSERKKNRCRKRRKIKCPPSS